MITADLTGKAVLVTGGSSGIGLAAVELFAKNGATVAMNHLPEDNRAPAEIARLTGAGLKVIPAPGNVSKPGDAERMAGEAIQALGRLDILINNAGTPGSLQPIDFADLDAMTEEFWQLILSTNLIGPLPLRACRRSGAEEHERRDRQHRLRRRARTARQQHGLRRLEGRRHQPDQGSRPRACAGRARQRGRAGACRHALDQSLAGRAQTGDD